MRARHVKVIFKHTMQKILQFLNHLNTIKNLLQSKKKKVVQLSTKELKQQELKKQREEKEEQMRLERLKKYDNALDVIYSELQKSLNVYSFYPVIATQRVSFSDIENKVTDYKWLIK